MCLGIPGQIVELVDVEKQIAKVDVSGVRRNVHIGLLQQQPSVGEWVLIHVGFAISTIDEAEAHAANELLRSLGDIYDQELAELKQSEIG